MHALIVVFTVIATSNYASASIGNASPYYGKCLRACLAANCTNEGKQFASKDVQPFHLKLLRWSCEDECGYTCMWKTVYGFQERNFAIPQFYGKWPFIRVLGAQEPASVVFSLSNLYVHVKMLKVLRKEVRQDSPLLWLWYIHGVLCCHAWIWSAIFHARDFEFTEFMDYSCAFSIVMISCYCMTIRLLLNYKRFVLIIISTFFVAFYFNHVAYLYMGRFDYGYNMHLNIFIGALTVMGWFVWSCWNIREKPHVWKVRVYVMLAALTTLLEIVDVPPILWTFDFHSLWHLSTVPTTYFIYSFAVDDCKYLRKRQLEGRKKVKDSK